MAVLLLLASGWTVAFGATPLADSHCECTHGPDADCDCPHHAAAQAEDATLPPCHRALKHATRAPAASGPSFRAKCGASQPSLLLVTLMNLGSPLGWIEPRFERDAVPAVAAAQVDLHLAPLRRPPRS